MTNWPSVKLALKREQEEWRWANYWLYVQAMILLSAAFLVGIAIGFALPA